MPKSKKKNIHLLSFHDVGTPFVPLLWPSAKTYYETYGKHCKNYNWVLPVAEFSKDLKTIKQEIAKYPPDIFGVSLYVWNFELSLEVCKWVKETYPQCLVITGGPHQYFNHRNDWFTSHWFIDASLPSDVYGELALCDLLDHYAGVDKVDWNEVEQIIYPLSFDRSIWQQSTKSTYKRLFKWDYSPYASQAKHMRKYIEKYNKVRTHRLAWKFETTRGCPYSCTFCDWGGGISSKTIFKDIKYVKQDIDLIVQYSNSMIYMCDANFGIGGDRDVEIIQYLADKKNEKGATVFLYYGGVAKTNRHFGTIRKILEIEAKNLMSDFYKISIQTFDREVLENIKRTDLRKEEHWELQQFLKDTYGYNSQVELIIGLPGMTLDKWCEDFTEPYDRGVQAQVYEWHLLPESEAYNPVYRKKYNIETSKKLMNHSEWHIPAEIVVSTNSYTPQEYKLMWIAYSIYILFYRGGVYKNVIKEIKRKHNLTFGQILRKFLTELYPILRESNIDTYKQFEEHLDHVVDKDHVNDYRFLLKCDFKNHKDQELYFHMFFLMEYFTNFDTIDPIIRKWFSSFGVKENIINKDSLLILSENKINTTKFDWFKIYKYNRYQNFNEFADEIKTYTFYYPGALHNKPDL